MYSLVRLTCMLLKGAIIHVNNYAGLDFQEKTLGPAGPKFSNLHVVPQQKYSVKNVKSYWPVKKDRSL